ncbi:MAG: hypothetical protein IIT53_15495 [Fibrobacter sp.]|nr:hypothetical protein [Fibrobacter sp.]
MSISYYCGRRPKSDAFDDTPDPTFLGEEDDLNKEEEELLEEDIDEEVDLTSRLLAVTPFGLITARIWNSTSDLVA